MKQAFKWSLRILLVLVVLLTITVGGTFLWLSTATGRNYAQNMVKIQLSEAVGYAITAEGLHFSFPLNARISHLALADREGVWLEADDIALNVLPSPAMRHQLTLRQLKAANLHLLRLPLTDNKEKEEHQSGGIDVSLLDMQLASIILPASITSLPAEYEGTLTGAVNWSASSEQLNLDLVTRMQRGIPGLEQVELKTKANLDLAQNALAITDLALTHPALNATGSATLDLTANTLQSTLSATVPDISHFAPTAQGKASVKAEISGPTAQPHVIADMIATGLQMNTHPLPDLNAHTTADIENSTITGTLNATSADGGTMQTSYAYTAPILSLSNLAATYKQATLNAEITLNTESLLAQGDAHLAIPELETLSEYLPIAITGQSQADIHLAAPETAQSAEFTVDATRLKTPYAFIAKAHAKASFADMASLRPETASLSATGITREGIMLDRLTLTATPKGESWHLDLATQGAVPQPITLATIADITPTETGYDIAVASLNGRFDNHDFKITSPATVTTATDNYHLAAPGFTYGQGQYSLNAALEDAQIKADLKGSKISAGDIMAQPARQLASARASLMLSLSGEAARPNANATLIVTQLTLAPKAPSATLKATAAFIGGVARLNADITQGKTATSHMEVAIPVQFSLQPYAFAIADNAAISGKANLSVDVTSLAQLLVPPPHTLAGTLKASLALGGTYVNPAITGPIAFTGGKYSYPNLGITLNDLTAHASAQNTAITLTDFSATDGKNHRLTGKGAASFGGDLTYNAQFAAKDFIFLRHPNARGVFSADIAISGDAGNGLVKGNIHNEQLDINLPDRVVGEVPQLNIVRSIPAKKTDIVKTKPVKPAYPLLLDLLFNADNKVFVRGRGVDAEMKGSLAVQGHAAKPEVSGKLSTIRGRYEQFGKQFTLATAELTFVGDIPPSPYLNIEASIKVGDNDIRPVISGPLLKPDLKIESTPSMPQEEALSLLLFGEDSKKLSAFQAVQLANSLRELSGHGGGGGFDPIGKIRKLIGVDDITIKNDDSNPDPSVGVGKYIGDKVYLQLEQGAGEASSKAKAEVEVTPGISLESGTSATGASSVGLNWKHDY